MSPGRATGAVRYIVVDVETAGPNPGQYALLSIGACTVGEPRETFYVELQPDRDTTTEEAVSVHGLSMEQLAREGTPPGEAMRRFAVWVAEVTPEGVRPLFVGFNAPFDWMFVNDYFHRYLGRNPFGHAALDIKALYMGAADVPWEETSMRHLAPRYLGGVQLTHNALQDAIDQARILEGILDELAGRGRALSDPTDEDHSGGTNG
ncbi:MAG: exonuclease domain-containing protein [Anaerolineae bacterium]|jgi:DNA polymerase III epsilon subunit-like protein